MGNCFEILTVIPVIVTAYRRHRIAAGNDELVVSADVVRRLRTHDVELREIQSTNKTGNAIKRGEEAVRVGSSVYPISRDAR